MASIAAKSCTSSSSNVSSVMTVQEKVSRNKRKFRAYQTPLSDSEKLAFSLQDECLSYMFSGESFSREEMDSVKLDSGVGSDVNAECNDADWSDLTETELEELVSSNLDTMFKSAIKRIVSYGYSEEVAVKGVLRSGHCCGSKDVVSNIVENSLVFLKNGKEVEPLREHKFENLEEMEKYILAELVCVVREVRPVFSTGDAMWCLLISDMNVSQACAMDGESSSGLVGDKGSNGCSSNSVETQPKKAAAPVMASIPKAEVPDSKQKASFVLDGFVSQKGKKGTAYRTMTRSFSLEEKGVGSRKITGKRDYILRQKSVHLEKGYRSHGLKGSSRTVKLGNIGGFILDKKLKYVSETTSISPKSASLKINESRGTINNNGLISASLFNTKIANKNISTLPKANIKPMSALSVAETELSLSLPAKTNNTPIPDAPNVGFSAMPYDKSSEQCISQDKKDETTLKLVTRVRELQNQMQEWTEWANQKVMQVARRLGKDKTELKTLKQEKEEVERLKKEKQTLEESTMKKLTEMENALSKASSQVGRANATVCKLDVENAKLRLEMEAAKLQAAESAVSCEEISKREKKTLMQLQLWEKQKTLFQEELIAEKRKLAQFKENLEQAKEQRDQIETKWKHEEKAKQELVIQAIMYRTQRQEGEVLAKSREDLIRLKADKNLQRYKDDIEKLEKEISLLKLKSDSSKIAALKRGIDGSYASKVTDVKAYISPQTYTPYVPNMVTGNGGVKRERECVMCLSEEMSVVFLPCAHQVVCTKCNELHEKQGMKDCPSCRGPIQSRICVRYARS
ncbi:putative E3 ubiquitin-protein ligase RF298 [Tanacetum coccineum]|uniref:E3 ubiquitin-protein ligase RF298 n=1 Tax=Tanacetum coccineum TaxID=301880 RepID=A0ABQ5DNB3_9ASTR